MRHEYIGKVTSEEERKREEKRARLDGEWKQARIDAEHARQKLHQAKLLSLKGELISRAHVTKQMTFLAISMRQHLLSIPAQHSRSLLDIAEEHEMRAKLDAIIRDALDVIADLPRRVVDPRWLETLDEIDERDENEATKRPARGR